MGRLDFLICLLLSCVSQCRLQQEQIQKSLESGRSHYESYQNEAKKDGCWRAAVSSLTETCRELSQSAQQRLAIAFANCHWSSAERRTYKCTDDMSIANCTSDMTESAFDVYTQFFNHIEDTCFYLQSQLWQEKTDRLITGLSDTSEQAVTKITESLKRHEILQKGQEQSLANQHQLIKNGQELQNQLDSARQEVSAAFSGIQEQAGSFKEQFTEIFVSLSDGLDRIHLILTWLLGEFISIQRFVVFVVGMVMAYLLTCSKHTAQARPLLMMIIVVESLVIERSIISWYVNGENNTNNMEQLHFMLWILRYITMFICCFLLVYFFMSYCNYEAVNQQLLQKIIEQNRQIKRHFNLNTEEDPDELSWFNPAKTSTPSPSIVNETFITNEAVVKPVASQSFQNEISRPRLDSVDQPDSGIEEVVDSTLNDTSEEVNVPNSQTLTDTSKEDTAKEDPTKCRYNLRRRHMNCRPNKILEHESPEQFARVVYHNEQLTRRGLRSLNNSNHNNTSLRFKTPCLAFKRHYQYNV